MQRTLVGVSMLACVSGVNRHDQQEENGTTQYYRRGGKGKRHLATYSTRAKISCIEELNKQCESTGVRWLLSYDIFNVWVNLLYCQLRKLMYGHLVTRVVKTCQRTSQTPK